MPITFECPSCQKSYRVQDTHAGKKFRCKNCESVISVPFEEVEILEEDEDDWGEDDSWNAPPASSNVPKKRPGSAKRRPKSKGRSSRRRSNSSDSMPVSLMVVLGVMGLVILINIGGVLTSIAENPAYAVGRGMVTAIQLALLIGLIYRSNVARIITIIFSCLPVILSVVALIGAFLAADKLPAETLGEVVFSCVLLFGISAMIITVLSSESVRDYCS